MFIPGFSDGKYKIKAADDEGCLHMKKDGEMDKKECDEEFMAICAGNLNVKLL